MVQIDTQNKQTVNPNKQITAQTMLIITKIHKTSHSPPLSLLLFSFTLLAASRNKQPKSLTFTSGTPSRRDCSIARAGAAPTGRLRKKHELEAARRVAGSGGRGRREAGDTWEPKITANASLKREKKERTRLSLCRGQEVIKFTAIPANWGSGFIYHTHEPTPPCSSPYAALVCKMSARAFCRWLGLTAVSVIFEYDTPKFVHIRNKKVGLLNRLVQLIIVGYIIG